MQASSTGDATGGGNVSRRQAAIAFVDVVGYSRILESDEVRAHQNWMTVIDTVIRPQLVRLRGTIIKSTGDGLLLEFQNAVEAVDWSIAVQRSLLLATGERDEQFPPISLRISVHLGEVISSDFDVFGDAVNVAARLQSQAPVGGVIMSGAVYEIARTTLRMNVRALGDVTLKNVEKPVRAFALDLGAEASLARHLRPPVNPLPPPSPATKFDYIDGRIDVVAPSVWQDHATQAASYHSRARALAAAFAERLRKTDAVPDVAGSVSALIDVLGDDFAKVQPDQLRLASRSITAKARAYGHPAAQWEISAESVSAIFELADVLTDLQSFARTEIEEHENAIRGLDLTPQNVAEAKAGLDFVSEGVLASQDIISERVEIAFESATGVSDTASDGQVKVAVEGDRTLLTANLALAVARQLGRDADTGAAQAAGGPPNKPPQSEPPEQQPEKPERPKRRRRAGRAGARGERSWDDFAERVMARIHKKGPDALADATIQAAASAIKHAPKTAAALGAALVVWSMSNPIVLAGGGIAATMAWIGYELRRRNASQGK